MRDSERHLVIKRKHEPSLKKTENENMSHPSENCVCLPSTVSWALPPVVGNMITFLTFYPQPNQWWILGICRNELTPLSVS